MQVLGLSGLHAIVSNLRETACALKVSTLNHCQTAKHTHITLQQRGYRARLPRLQYCVLFTQKTFLQILLMIVANPLLWAKVSRSKTRLDCQCKQHLLTRGGAATKHADTVAIILCKVQELCRLGRCRLN